MVKSRVSQKKFNYFLEPLSSTKLSESIQIIFYNLSLPMHTLLVR